MNKCMIKSLIVVLVLLVPCLAFALPGPHDPTSGKGYSCNSCHTYGSSVGNTDARFASNLCFRCHGNVETYPEMPSSRFLTEDFATLYVPTTVTQTTKTRSSHKWFGTDVNPGAGAQAPVDTAINGLNKRASFLGNLFCARCHNVHGTSGVQSNSKPYLRYPNDKDQMCLNCHRSRNTKDHKLGTHPVNISYTSASAKAKIADGTLLATPVVTPTTTPGQVSQVKLINGMVVCSTCHGVHNTDSRSSTFDPFSSTHTFGQLSSSAGYLLRVDAYGKTVNDVNICTNCHAKKKNHNLGGKNGTKPVQCNDCHSGHVEYDPAAVGAETTPNSNLVRRYLQYSTIGRPSKRIFYRYTGSLREFTNASGKGVCQGCHYLPNAGGDDHFAGGGTFPNIPSPDRKNCTSCHQHAASTGAFSYSAGSNCLSACHGWPPVNNNTSGAGSRTSGYVGYDESKTPHGAHAAGGTSYYNFDCYQCHKGSAMPQSPSSTQSYYREVFLNTTGAGVWPGTTATYTPTYNLLPSTCNNVYCHSRGNGTWKAGQNAVQWGENITTIIGQPGATRCNTCHDTAMATGSHTKHLASMSAGYGCVNCHATTVDNNTTLRASALQQIGSHVNGVKNVEFNDVSPAVGTTCATIACHSNGKGAAPREIPVWGTATTGQCGDCHMTRAFGNISSGRHKVTAHISTADDTQCNRCHTYTGETAAPHVNGTINVDYTVAGCAANSCHGNITPPTWTVALTGIDVCTKCHGKATVSGGINATNRYLVAPQYSSATEKGQVSADAKIGAHKTHLKYLNNFSNYSTVDYRCQSCHGTPALPALGTHANGSSSPVGSFRYLATRFNNMTGQRYVGTTCSNTYCHNPARIGGTLANVGSNPSPSWNDPTYLDNNGKNQANCGKCHKVPGDSGFSKQSAHGANTTNTGYSCVGCHGHNGDTAGTPGRRHMDGVFYANGACDSCHGYPPMTATQFAAKGGTFVNGKVEDYAGGGGYHILHLATNITAANDFAPCLPCHPSGYHQLGVVTDRSFISVNDAADTGYRFDSTRSKRYNKTTWSCSNVSCHFMPTPAWNTAP